MRNQLIGREELTITPSELQEARQLFDKYDLNGDGLLQAAEARAAGFHNVPSDKEVALLREQSQKRVERRKKELELFNQGIDPYTQIPVTLL